MKVQTVALLSVVVLGAGYAFLSNPNWIPFDWSRGDDVPVRFAVGWNEADQPPHVDYSGVVPTCGAVLDSPWTCQSSARRGSRVTLIARAPHSMRCSIKAGDQNVLDTDQDKRGGCWVSLVVK